MSNVISHVLASINQSLLNCVSCVVMWVRGSVGCVGQFFTWVAWVTWVKIFFTWVISFTWVAWVKYIFAWVFAWVNFYLLDEIILLSYN